MPPEQKEFNIQQSAGCQKRDLVRDINKGVCGKGGESAEGGEEEALPRVGGQHGQTSCTHLVS